MFVWTISDVIGVIILGLIILIGLAYAAALFIEHLQRKYRQWRKK